MVKWTPEADQLLLLLILRTHSIQVNTSRVAAEWPQDKGEVPTPRAITERLVKIRANAGQTFSITSSQVKGASGSGVSTPNKAPASASNTPRKSKAPATPSSRKRRAMYMSAADDTDEEDLHVSKREASALDESPSARFRPGSATFATHTSGGRSLVELNSPDKKRVLAAAGLGSRDVSPSPVTRKIGRPTGFPIIQDGYQSGYEGDVADTPTDSPIAPRARAQRAASAKLREFIKREQMESAEEEVAGESDYSEYMMPVEEV